MATTVSDDTSTPTDGSGAVGGADEDDEHDDDGRSARSAMLDAWMFPPELTVRDRFHQLVAALAEPFWFRPMTVWWRLRATARWLRRGQAEWGTMTRSGFSAPDDGR